MPTLSLLFGSRSPTLFVTDFRKAPSLGRPSRRIQHPLGFFVFDLLEGKLFENVLTFMASVYKGRSQFLPCELIYNSAPYFATSKIRKMVFGLTSKAVSYQTPLYCALTV